MPDGEVLQTSVFCFWLEEKNYFSYTIEIYIFGIPEQVYFENIKIFSPGSMKVLLFQK